MTRDRSNMTPKASLDAVLCEAREDLVPPGRGANGDFSAIDAKLFGRIAEEQGSQATSIVRARRIRTIKPASIWGGVGFVAAAAAAVILVSREPSSPPGTSDRGSQAASDPAAAREELSTSTGNALASAASFRERDGGGEIRIAGNVAELGRGLRVSEVVETTDARGLFVSGTAKERPAVTWLLEERSQVKVEHAQSPLVLALSKGAVEAQVAPVERGEAFAVDVDGVRVAVHGTHLRVQRSGGHVVLDLTEGVVAIGAIPRQGLTEGTVVTAPAHVEFDSADVAGTFRIDRTAASLRAAVALEPQGSGAAGARSSAARDGSTQLEKPATGRPAPPAPATVRPEEVITKGVRACMAEHLRETAVRITVSSKLSLKVAEDGSVQLARFNPPLAPGAQECASRVIYKTRFPRGGDVEIPLSIE